MTRSPIFATLLPLLPLAALGWPLAKVLNQEDYQPPEPLEKEAAILTKADLFLRSAHPYTSASVTANGATWTFGPDEDLQEINFPTGDQVKLIVSVTWPEGTPETAALFTLRAEGKEDRSQTLWGFGEVSEEITFTWEGSE